MPGAPWLADQETSEGLSQARHERLCIEILTRDCRCVDWGSESRNIFFAAIPFMQEVPAIQIVKRINFVLFPADSTNPSAENHINNLVALEADLDAANGTAVGAKLPS